MQLQNLLAFGGLICLALSAPTPASKSKRDWDDWTCTPDKVQTRVDFASMPQWERKSFTDAMKCIMDQPSNLDQATYPAAINRYFDYAVVHVSRTQYVHISGFFLTWHRYFLYLFEQDLRNICGYSGRWPYWNFAATAGALESSAVFNGDDYSMSGNGEFVAAGPIQLGPALSIPHGSGGGCVTTGPFANLITTLGFIDPVVLQSGTLPPNAYAYNASCLRRDLNNFVSTSYTNLAQVINSTYAPSAYDLELALNGIIGSASLGVHSGAHFEVGGQMNSIHISAQDPIWYPLHTFIDLIYDSWQKNNPEISADQFGTGTALNIPPSPNVTVDSIEPDWGYFQTAQIPVSELLSTTSGPFCYQYDLHLQ